MKRSLLALLLLVLPASSWAQTSLSTTTCPGTGCVAMSTSGHGSVGVQITGTFSGTVTFEASLDSSTYASLPMTPIAGGASVTTATATGIWSGNVAGMAYVRVRFSAYTSGTAVISLALSPTPINSAMTTLTTQPSGWLFTNLATNATTTIKSGSGVLHCLTVNILGTTSQAVLYDNTAGSGTKIGTVTTLIAGQSGCYDAAFSTGLTVVTTGALAADITVSYR